MSFPATKCRRVIAALKRIGWVVVRTAGSHRQLEKNGVRVTIACHDSEEIGPKLLARIAAQTGLTESDL